MLCTQAQQLPAGPGWAIEPKLDGWRLVAHRWDAGVRVYGGRNSSDYTGQLPYLERELLELPVGTALDGEIVAGAGWGSVQSVMTSAGAHAPNDASPALTFFVFDILRIGETFTRFNPWIERRRLLEELMSRFDLEHVKLVPAVLDEPTPTRLLGRLLAEGFEGAVAKAIDSPYLGDRHPTWLKVKYEATDEARIIGFKEGSGSRAGTHGAFEIEMLDEEGNPSGIRTRCKIQDTIHAAVNANPGAWLDAIIEVKHNGLGKSGKPRHPQYLRRRDDR